jgi:hypothetical protein
MQRTRIWLAAAVAVALAYGLAAPQVQAAQLAETAIYFEINDTDGDAGVQIFLDGEGWNGMKVFDPNGKKILDVSAEGSVGIQGITELFLESAEPSFDEQPLAELLALFPEGNYRFEGTTTEGAILTGRARLTHALPAAPLLVLPIEDDDSVDPDNTVIQWQLVPDPPGSKIVGYQVVVEREKPSLRVFTADVGPSTTSVTVPPEFMQPGTTYKFEVLAIEASGNRTISERGFKTEK